MNNIIEMMNGSFARIKKISDGAYNESVTKAARREFGLQIGLLNATLRLYVRVSKNKRAAKELKMINILDGNEFVDMGLGGSEIGSVMRKILEQTGQCGELLKKIKENRSTVEFEEVIRERKLQSKLFNAVERIIKWTSKNRR